MQAITLPRHGTFAVWRDAARALLAHAVPPQSILWSEEEGSASLFDGETLSSTGVESRALVPKAFLALCDSVICHRDPQRFALLYALLWRLQDNRLLLEDASDPMMAQARAMEKSVRRDCHKMKAFVRFKEQGISEEGRRRFAAWFEPEHFIVERTAPFFMRRFADMDWLIATPHGTAQWLSGELRFVETPQHVAAGADPVESLWHTYFANIFNPARLKVKAMQAEMPKKYWKNLPETRLIPELIATAEQRAADMQNRLPLGSPKAERIKAALESSLPIHSEPAALSDNFAGLRVQASSCQRCPLFSHATQTVFGEGPEQAAVMFVGEQPGDKEDLVGRPFVGPAGRLFDEILGDAGIAREKCYITNAVKHFKFEPRGKFRLHKRPNAGEVDHCRWWLERERHLVKPRLLVALGATAALALTGQGDAILARRGQVEMASDGTPVLITVHPSSLLRQPNAIAASDARATFCRDLRMIADRVPEVALAQEQRRMSA